MATKLPPFEAIGAWELGRCDKRVSGIFLVPKPGTNKWRLIIDLRELNKWCKTLKMSYETLKHMRHLARACDWFVSMDLADGYYALGIWEEDRDFFTDEPTRRFMRNTCWRGYRLVSYMDDFHFFADSREESLELRVQLDTMLDRLGFPNKGVWEPTQVGPHLGLIVDPQRGEFCAPEEKVIAQAKASRSPPGRATSDRRWLPARQLASFAGKDQFLY
eukprot:jgi/Tetstr1/435091/TSEL_024059.t1